MATTAIGRKLLGNLAELVSRDHGTMGSDLFVLLGLSVSLADRVATMQRYIKSSDITDTEVTALRYHILLLIREGLAIVEARVAPFTDAGQFGLALQIMTLKLRASFYNILCLHHNEPPIVTSSSRKTKHPAPEAETAIHPSQRHPSTPPPRAPDSPNIKDSSTSPPEVTVTSSDDTAASLITNPWSPARPIPQPYAKNLPPFPTTSNPATFIMPLRDNIPTTLSLFETALELAEKLPGSAPLRLSVVVDFCSFLQRCMNDGKRARKLASEAVKAVYQAHEGMEDSEFEDAAALVGLLGVVIEKVDGDAAEGQSVEDVLREAQE